MSKLSDGAVVERCGGCLHCFDNYNGEYDYPIIEPKDYKNPECGNMPMTDDGCFPYVNPDTIHPDCPLQTVIKIDNEMFKEILQITLLMNNGQKFKLDLNEVRDILIVKKGR